MRTTDRAHPGAPALLAAVAATAAVGLAAFARTGAALCGHRVFVHHHGATMTMHGTAMAGGAPPAALAGGVCPILLYAAAVAAALCVLAAIVLVGARAAAPTLIVAAARSVVRLRVGPLTAVLSACGVLPLAAILMSEGGIAGPAAAGALASLLAGAFACALAFASAARVALAFATRLAVAIAAAFRLLAPGADAPWVPAAQPLLVRAGVRRARRGASRAPPALR